MSTHIQTGNGLDVVYEEGSTVWLESRIRPENRILLPNPWGLVEVLRETLIKLGIEDK